MQIESNGVDDILQAFKFKKRDPKDLAIYAPKNENEVTPTKSASDGDQLSASGDGSGQKSNIKPFPMPPPKFDIPK